MYIRECCSLATKILRWSVWTVLYGKQRQLDHYQQWLSHLFTHTFSSFILLSLPLSHAHMDTNTFVFAISKDVQIKKIR